MVLTTAVVLIGLVAVLNGEILISKDGHSRVEVTIVKKDGLNLQLFLDNETKLTAHIGRNIDITDVKCYDTICFFNSISNNTFMSLYALEDDFKVQWAGLSSPFTTTFEDCYDLNSTQLSWYGGPEVWETRWPIEKLTFKNRPYISSKLDNGAVVERYWLNSEGGYVWVDPNSPLFVDQNNKYQDKVCFIGAKELPYQTYASELTYVLAAKNNPKDAHLSAIKKKYVGKPGLFPDYAMIREPIWTTWGKYKVNINDLNVVEYLKNIYYHNFTKGQIEIDDKWEVCYGDLTFDETSRFADINKTVATIHKYGFRATLWVHPFVNTDCSVPVAEGKRNGLFVNSSTGNAVTSWWNGDSSYVIDFTNPDASAWFRRRLLKLHDDFGIDGFKCDAGENDWLPEEPIFYQDYNDAPNAFTRLYVKACEDLGPYVEVRSAHRTQGLGVFVRMLDKDSVWGTNNGLKSLVHSLLQFNMIGYTLVLPDLVGGNGYKELPTPELLVRWTQANAFMPAIQFSYLPWELANAPFNTTEIVRHFIDLHEQYSQVIIDAMWNSTIWGAPVNPPIWWLDPTDLIALKVDDEFLLGDRILVAPILDQGQVSRDIYLPIGNWKDGNNGTIYKGGRYLKNYPAPIDILPFFLNL